MFRSKLTLFRSLSQKEKRQTTYKQKMFQNKSTKLRCALRSYLGWSVINLFFILYIIKLLIILHFNEMYLF